MSCTYFSFPEGNKSLETAVTQIYSLLTWVRSSQNQQHISLLTSSPHHVLTINTSILIISFHRQGNIFNIQWGYWAPFNCSEFLCSHNSCLQQKKRVTKIQVGAIPPGDVHDICTMFGRAHALHANPGWNFSVPLQQGEWTPEMRLQKCNLVSPRGRFISQCWQKKIRQYCAEHRISDDELMEDLWNHEWFVFSKTWR